MRLQKIVARLALGEGKLVRLQVSVAWCDSLCLLVRAQVKAKWLFSTSKTLQQSNFVWEISGNRTRSTTYHWKSTSPWYHGKDPLTVIQTLCFCIVAPKRIDVAAEKCSLGVLITLRRNYTSLLLFALQLLQHLSSYFLVCPLLVVIPLLFAANVPSLHLC